MLFAIVAVFIIGYLLIAMEHVIKINKSATALLLGMILWVMYSCMGVGHLDEKIIEHMGDITEILFFLIGAMTIVELVDIHGGFSIITERITTRKKRKLLWILSFVTFFMSAVLDNLTTSIVMVMLLRKLVKDQYERWLYASMVIIAANSGGAWSPIGDITTIMLWVKGNVGTLSLIKYDLLPSLVAMIVPLLLIGRMLNGELEPIEEGGTEKSTTALSKNESNWFFYLGVGGLIFVPIFKAITHLPPFIGMLLVLGVLWIFTEILYNRKQLSDKIHEKRLPAILSRIDTPTILFFLGILMAVAVLQETGILGSAAAWLDTTVGDIYVINIVLGMFSSIVDNVPLVAAAIGMYPLATPDMVLANEFMMNFVPDGTFWLLLSYCAGVGGSMLIIGSAAGVVVMGLEKMNFVWYLEKIAWIALLGYLAGVLAFAGEMYLF